MSFVGLLWKAYKLAVQKNLLLDLTGSFFSKVIESHVQKPIVFGMAAMPLLCNGTFLFQGNLPWVLPVIIKNILVVLSPKSIRSYFFKVNGLA